MMLESTGQKALADAAFDSGYALVMRGDPPAGEAARAFGALAFEHCTQGMLITDAAQHVVAVNPPFCAMTGYAAPEFDRECLSLLTAGAEGAEALQQAWEAAARSGAWQGEIECRRKDGSRFSAWLGIGAVRNAAGIPTHYAVTLLDVSARKQAEQEILRLAHHDPLTGLANRSLLQDRLQQAIASCRRSGEGLAVLFIDLDRFKNINDSLGHAIGDAVLQRTAERLIRSVREEDTVARVGGDEFVVVLRGVRDAQAPVSVAKKIAQELFRALRVNGRDLRVTASIGISLFPEDGVDGQALVQHADTAMYRAKEHGRNSYAFYRRRMTVRVKERLLLENGLRSALERNEFVLFYQPQIDIPSGKVIGAEALLRWKHPDLGLISPDRFIPIAEDTGLIRPIGAWVLRAVCADMAAWHASGIRRLRIAVNLSAHQILRSKHTDSLRTLLKECWSPIEGMDLEVEITESSLQTTENSLATATSLKELGLSLAVDDFGTGYSSMSSLKLLPLDRLKIDKSFIDGVTRDARDASVAAAIIAMAKALGLKVLAEGVETNEQFAFLRANGCDEAQGFLFSRPLPAEEFLSYLAQHPGAAV